MPYQCANHSSILPIGVCTKVTDAESGESFKTPAAGSDPSIGACSCSLCKWKSLRPGSGMCRFDGVHSLTAKHILHSSDKRDMSGTSTHLSPAAEPGGPRSWMVVIIWHDSEQKSLTRDSNYNCCCSYCLWKLAFKKSLRWSALPTETSVNIPPENSIPPHKWKPDMVFCLLMAIM